MPNLPDFEMTTLGNRGCRFMRTKYDAYRARLRHEIEMMDHSRASAGMSEGANYDLLIDRLARSFPVP